MWHRLVLGSVVAVGLALVGCDRRTESTTAPMVTPDAAVAATPASPDIWRYQQTVDGDGMEACANTPQHNPIPDSEAFICLQATGGAFRRVSLWIVSRHYKLACKGLSGGSGLVVDLRSDLVPMTCEQLDCEHADCEPFSTSGTGAVPPLYALRLEAVKPQKAGALISTAGNLVAYWPWVDFDERDIPKDMRRDDRAWDQFEFKTARPDYLRLGVPRPAIIDARSRKEQAQLADQQERADVLASNQGTLRPVDPGYSFGREAKRLDGEYPRSGGGAWRIDDSPMQIPEYVQRNYCVLSRNTYVEAGFPLPAEICLEYSQFISETDRAPLAMLFVPGTRYLNVAPNDYEPQPGTIRVMTAMSPRTIDVNVNHFDRLQKAVEQRTYFSPRNGDSFRKVLPSAGRLFVEFPVHDESPLVYAFDIPPLDYAKLAEFTPDPAP